MTRRRILTLSLTLIAALALTTGGSQADEADDIPMFRGNAAHTGEMPGPGPDPAHGVQVRWQFATGSYVDSSPAVVDGVVYAGGSDGNIYALDAATGTERWRFAIGVELRFSPAVVNGVVYVGGSDGNVYALEAAQPVLETGATAEVTEEGTAVRGGPAGTVVVRAELDKGARVTITGVAMLVDETTWWPVMVNDTGTPGWIDGERLQAVWSE